MIFGSFTPSPLQSNAPLSTTTLGSPAWFEAVFFAVVGVHVGEYVQLARTKLVGRWWEVWR